MADRPAADPFRQRADSRRSPADRSRPAADPSRLAADPYDPAPDARQQPADPLRHHGDREVGEGLVDLAVNVQVPAPPGWLLDQLTAGLAGLAAYPDATAATAAVAARHGRRTDEVLLTSGAAEAFTLLARALRPGHEVKRAVVVHPQFTEPEVALSVAGHAVERVLLDPSDGFALHPGAVPDDADLVVVGNPTNPTSVLHPAATLRQLARAGRVLVVDEAFMDAVPGEPESLTGERLPGLVVVRSLTKTWGLAGLRAGYLVGDADVLARCAQVQPAWSVSSLALLATVACCTPQAAAEARAMADRLVGEREHLVRGLTGAGLHVVTPAAAPFVLVRAEGAQGLRVALRDKGFAVRRGDTFPGLGADWLRVAVRPREVTDALVAAVRDAVSTPTGAR
ncbi:MAG TPA: Rv2231c family pyridoxal phosphate-dependent protein CobC [Actinomycetales bacterium]|nr:Rv2231c family pyridoxal phosphate-dependent protein CobC [Actinomycetales bacterium]